MEEYYFCAKDLCVGYNNTPLIHGIDFSVKRGEILILIGPNGAGKSTILKSITRYLKSLSGVITINGNDIMKMTRHQLSKQMSVVLTDRIRPELMTCRDVVAMGRYPYTNGLGHLTKEDEAIISESLEKMNALDLSDRDFNQLSDGQKQRVILARALCQKPDIMVLDEPTSFLDIRYKVELLNSLRQMAAEGITIILSLHEIEMAYKLADQVMCVKGDEISMVGTPEEVFAKGHISELFDLTDGEYNRLLGSVELKKPEGEAEVLVIGGNGTGISVYRKLQKQGIPFLAGLLFENDVDVQVAKALAKEVILADAFSPVSAACEERMNRALSQVKRVIDCGCVHGVYDEINTKIIEAAKAAGKWERCE